MNQRASKLHSITTQIFISIITAVVLTGVLMILTYSPNISRTITSSVQDYLVDIVDAYGNNMTRNMEAAEYPDSLLKGDYLSKYFENVKLINVEGSYMYMVNAAGNCLYHPDGSLVGRKIEDETILSNIQSIAEGKSKTNIFEATEDGEKIYCAVYVHPDDAFRLIAVAKEEAALSPISKINRQGMIGLFVSLVICCFVAMQMSKAIVRPINEITRVTMNVSEMDFTVDAVQDKLDKRKDEVGSVSKALTMLRREISRMVIEIKNESKELTDAADVFVSNADSTARTMEQIGNAVNEISEGASSQADETQKATESVMLMGNMIEETNDLVGQLVEGAGFVQNSSEAAKKVIDELDSSNQKTSEYINIVSDQTNKTNESAKRISEAAQMITDIAEETNLLSLNASIEAARAGEQGRGFAVVASQIQKLAEQSSESAGQIEKIITELLADTRRSVEVMEEVRVIMESQNEQVQKTNEAFDVIHQGISKTISGMQQISDKSQKLDEERIVVVDVVQNLTAIAQENAAGAEETAASVTEATTFVEDISNKSKQLRGIADKLNKNMNVFKVES